MYRRFGHEDRPWEVRVISWRNKTLFHRYFGVDELNIAMTLGREMAKGIWGETERSVELIHRPTRMVSHIWMKDGRGGGNVVSEDCTRFYAGRVEA